MTLDELKTQITLGEDSHRQFKQDLTSPDALAAEMTAFSNADGGMILLGVADSPITVQTENVPVGNGQLLIVLTVPKGLDKPYFDRNGIIWLKSGSDKRRVNSKEELRRLFQSVDLLHADEVPTTVGVEAIDHRSLESFLRDTYSLELPEKDADVLRLLQNMNLASTDGTLNLAGVLLFAKHPEWVKPAFILKAVAFPGNAVEASTYLDSEDIGGRLRDVFDDTLRFIMRNLHKRQGKQSVNSIGEPEVPRLVFEELLVNALIHRDYFISAPVRVLIFTNRIEIISPGHLPNNLTVEKVKTGNSNLRNPILASFVAKKLLPYRGLGSGILRAIEAWPQIDFKDNREACLFTATIWRPADY